MITTLFAALALTIAAAPPTTAELLERIERLESRLAELERTHTTHPTGGDAPAMAGPSARVCRLLHVEPCPPDPKAPARIAELSAKVSEAETRAIAAETAVTKSSSERAANRKRAASIRESVKADALELAALRKLADTPRQRVTGWDGVRHVVLTTSGDLSAALSRAQPGSFIAWQGTRSGLSGEVDEWTVVGITGAERPLNFMDPPPGLRLPTTAQPPPPANAPRSPGGR